MEVADGFMKSPPAQQPSACTCIVKLCMHPPKLAPAVYIRSGLFHGRLGVSRKAACSVNYWPLTGSEANLTHTHR